MTKYLMVAISFCLILTGFSRAEAQEVPGPPSVIFIVREEIKPGKDAAHIEESHRFTQVLRKIKAPYGRIGMTAIAGNEHEVLYMWPFDSFASWEKMGQDMEKWGSGQFKADFDAIAPGPEDLHVSQRDMVGVFRPDLSYQANLNIAEMRYMMIETLRVRPGEMGNFTNGANLYIDGLKKGKVDSHFAIFQLVAGGPQDIFLVFQPMKSLAEMDKFQERFKAFRDAMGPEGLKSLDKIAGEVFNPGETMVYAFNPRMSYVQDDFAARDKSSTAFWNTKP
jgi:hypothetical protein